MEEHCDFKNCKSTPFAEIYDLEGRSWCYLCLTHFIKEKAWRRPWCLANNYLEYPFIKWAWEVYCSYFWRIKSV